MSQPAEVERSEAEAALARSEAELAASLERLAGEARSALSPARAAREHLGWLLLGAFALGFGLGFQQKERR